MIVVFVLLFLLVVGGTAAALAGRWRPEGLADGRPRQIEAMASDAAPRFEVVIRGYRMDQVDRELARLHEELLKLRGEDVDSVAAGGLEPTLDPGGAHDNPDDRVARGTDRESFGR